MTGARQTGASLSVTRAGDGVVVVTLNYAPDSPLLDQEHVTELGAVMAAVDADPADRVVLLRADGADFCRGWHTSDAAPGALRNAALQRSDLMRSLADAETIVVAAVAGAAEDVGVELVAAVDFAITTDESRFRCPGLGEGRWPYTVAVMLSRRLGERAALALLLDEAGVDAEQARQLGLIQRVVAATELDDAAVALARRIAAGPQAAAILGKRAFNHQARMDLAAAYDHASDALARHHGSDAAD